MGRAGTVTDATQRPATAQDFADIVGGALDGAVRHILTAGRALIVAKEQLDHGEFTRIFKDHPDPVERPLPFGIRTGQRLMKIAEHPVLSKATHASLLPTSWATLHELTRLPEPMLERALAEGHVHPGMERRHVLALRVDLTPRTSKVVVGAPLEHEYDPGPNTDMDLNDFDRDLSAAFPDLDRDEQVRVVARLRRIADTLEGQIRAVPVLAPAAAGQDDDAPEFICGSCQRELSKDDTIEVRECPQCEERFDGGECGRNCPTCNRPFSRLIAAEGCPDCLEECEAIDADVADETEVEVVT